MMLHRVRERAAMGWGMNPLLCVQQTMQSSKHTVRTGVFIGHAFRYPINKLI